MSVLKLRSGDCVLGLSTVTAPSDYIIIKHSLAAALNVERTVKNVKNTHLESRLSRLLGRTL